MTTEDTSALFELSGRRFLVTGGAGFIGSHIVRRLVAEGARVRVLDLFTTGRRASLVDVEDEIELFEGDICDKATVQRAVADVEYVLHLAALVSVPESVEQPERNFAVNLTGTHNLLLAARAAQVRRFVFSSTCAVYGDQTAPHQEELAPRALSPYAAAKLGAEQLCRSFTHVYGLPTVCLRYFNVFGPGQNPRGGYAAAIPLFVTALLGGEQPRIFGDGYQSRDFVYVGNVVDANLRACAVPAAVGGVFNIGTGRETSLRELLATLSTIAGREIDPIFAAPRVGDIRHSYGDITRAAAVLGYQPTVGLAEGLRETFAWYCDLGNR
jgi:nucleoside-diphosphate-sugar epimerase